MKRSKLANAKKVRRHRRVRAKIFGTATRPRLSVYRSLQHLYVQLIDDTKGATLLSVKDSEIKGVKNKTEQAAAVGRLLAEKALKQEISQAVFDRGVFKYHGRVRAVAKAAREAGLKI